MTVVPPSSGVARVLVPADGRESHALVELTTIAPGMSIGAMGSAIAKRIDDVIRAGPHDALRADGYRK